MKLDLRPLLFLSSFFVLSCAVDQNNLSPLTKSFTDAKMPDSLESSFNYSIKENLNAAEISNIIASFPKFSHQGVNREVGVLKTHLQNYLYALEAFNKAGMQRYMQGIEDSYKKIQKLRKHLSEDENQILNRQLVRIKTNISALESLNLSVSK